MGSDSFIKLVAANLDVLAGPLVTVVYPLYASFQAIRSGSSHVVVQQWFPYWLLSYFIISFELTFGAAIQWLPFWPYAKLIFTCWLVLPYFNGAAYIFRNYARPLLTKRDIIAALYSALKRMFMQLADLLSAAQKDIERKLLKFNKVPARSRYDKRTSRRRRPTILEEVEAAHRKAAKKDKGCYNFSKSQQSNRGCYDHDDAYGEEEEEDQYRSH